MIGQFTRENPNIWVFWPPKKVNLGTMFKIDIFKKSFQKYEFLYQKWAFNAL